MRPGEIKRVCKLFCSLQIDALPSYVVAIAATNHEALLDKAAWRRFQIRLEVPKPTRSNLEAFYYLFEKEHGFEFGMQPSTLAKRDIGMFLVTRKQKNLRYQFTGNIYWKYQM